MFEDDTQADGAEADDKKTSDTEPTVSLDDILFELKNIKTELSFLKAQNSEIKSALAKFGRPAIAEETETAAPLSLRRKLFRVASNIIFYTCMILLIIGALTFARSEDTEKSIFGYRYYYIKTQSMEPVLPVGSVVLTRSLEPDKINIGDDITVYVGDGQNDTYLTHRVVEIIQDTQGVYSFRTKGVNNRSNDPTPFHERLVVGKVILCVPVLGTIMLFIQSQLLLVVIIFVLLLGASFMLRILFTKDKTASSNGEPDSNSEGEPNVNPDGEPEGGTESQEAHSCTNSNIFEGE